MTNNTEANTEGVYRYT